MITSLSMLPVKYNEPEGPCGPTGPTGPCGPIVAIFTVSVTG